MQEVRAPGWVIPSGYDLDLALESVGKGWADLVRAAFYAKPEDTKIEQVKEKFGGLRIYTSPAPEEYSTIITALETLSYRTCEECGSGWNVETRVPKGGYWIKTLCELDWFKRENPVED